MFEYLARLFTTPHLQLTVLDSLVNGVLGTVAIILAVVLLAVGDVFIWNRRKYH
jgi:hypothetical protein